MSKHFNNSNLQSKRCLIKGKEWTKSKLSDLVKRLRPSEIERVIENYWEYIPKGRFTNEEKVSFVICAIPNSAAVPKELVISQLLIGPLGGPNPRLAYFAKPNILASMKNFDKDDNKLKELVELYRPHKRCPDYIKGNDDWCLLLILAEVIDRYPGAKTHRDFYDNCIKHIDYIKKFDKNYGK